MKNTLLIAILIGMSGLANAGDMSLTLFSTEGKLCHVHTAANGEEFSVTIGEDPSTAVVYGKPDAKGAYDELESTLPIRTYATLDKKGQKIERIRVFSNLTSRVKFECLSKNLID